MSETGNARIGGTFLGREDHGILTAYVTLEGGGWGQGFGGYALDTWSEKAKRRVGTAFGLDFIDGVLRVVGVESWEALTGKYVRYRRDSGGKLSAIGHITENKWFAPDEMVAAHDARSSGDTERLVGQ